MDRALRIFLAEDNSADAEVVKMALEKAGLTFELQLCTDGEAAVRFLDRVAADTEACPDLFLLDLNLPRIDGESILMTLRRNERYSSTPVVMVTSSANRADRERCLASGATHYFIKPPDLEEFMKLGTLVSNLLLDSSCKMMA